MIEQKNPLILAFIGDAVQTLYVREKLYTQFYTVASLHSQASKIICAKAQAKKFDEKFEQFSEMEKDIANRARNAQHHTVPKNCTLAEYHKATALEAVIGYNYLSGNHKRVRELAEC